MLDITYTNVNDRNTDILKYLFRDVSNFINITLALISGFVKPYTYRRKRTKPLKDNDESAQINPNYLKDHHTNQTLPMWLSTPGPLFFHNFSLVDVVLLQTLAED